MTYGRLPVCVLLREVYYGHSAIAKEFDKKRQQNLSVSTTTLRVGLSHHVKRSSRFHHSSTSPTVPFSTRMFLVAPRHMRIARLTLISPCFGNLSTAEPKEASSFPNSSLYLTSFFNRILG